MLVQLVYVSDRTDDPSKNEMDDILTACKKNNPDLGITGALLYSDKKFLQLVEGKNDVVMNLYDKIKEDDRHKNCVMVSYMPIKEKTFPSWHMGSKNFDKNDVDYKTNISAEDKATFSKLLEGSEEDGTKTRQVVAKFFD